MHILPERPIFSAGTTHAARDPANTMRGVEMGRIGQMNWESKIQKTFEGREVTVGMEALGGNWEHNSFATHSLLV